GVVVGVVVVVVVVVEGFCSPLPPHAAVSPPIAIRAPAPAIAAVRRTLRDLMMIPIYPRPAVLRRVRNPRNSMSLTTRYSKTPSRADEWAAEWADAPRRSTTYALPNDELSGV